MADMNFFQYTLLDVFYKGSKSVSKALRTLNEHESIKRVPFCGDLIDIVYADEDGSYLLVKFDFIDKKTNAEDWLADEEVFNDEYPMYFSESSHRMSPIHPMLRAKDFFAKLHPDAHIDMLLLCNYNIINYEDMSDIWNQIGVEVVHLIEDTTLPEFRIRLENLKIGKFEDLEQPETEPEEEEDEFQKLLNDFIDSELGIDEDANDETSKPEQDQKEEPSEFLIDSIKLFRGSYSKKSEINKDAVALKAFNIRGLDTITLLVDAYYSLGHATNEWMEITLYNEKGETLVNELVNVTFDFREGSMDTYLIYAFDKAVIDNTGNYIIEIRYNRTMSMPITFCVGNKNITGAYYHSCNQNDPTTHPFDALNRMIGLKQVKEQMTTYRNIMNLATQRRRKGLGATIPPLHAVFMGSSGTGKTTVARLYGAMLKEMGLLSSGHVVFRERSSLLGPNYSNEESKTLEAIEEARGGILFIDEAYNLYKANDPKDPGRNVIDALLTAMSNENDRDWALLLAGYSDEMAGLLSINQGLSSRIPERNRYHFKDYSLDELMLIADSYCLSNNYFMLPDTRKALRQKVSHDYQLRDEKFGNARHIVNLFTSEILPTMATRLSTIKSPSLLQLLTIEKEDIPALHLKDYKTSLKKLKEMVGLNDLKKSIESHLNMVKLSMLRNEQGIETSMPPLHMVFTGNPGTGKTTVASFIGEIYASLGLLSKGDVIYVERKDLVGQYLGETEKKTAEILKGAKGNVLFIDEAYTLAPKGHDKDYGHLALEVLLSTLSKEHIDMLVIMAGYPKEMDDMLNSNTGLKSRIPYKFHFVDYTADELMQIAEAVVKKSKFTFSPAAHRNLRKLIDFKLENQDTNWGNARFITRLISTNILPAMSNRLAKLPAFKQNDKKRLSLICREDIPSVDSETIKYSRQEFNEAAVKRALKKLNALVGLEQVKRNIHNFVEVARYMHDQGNSYVDNEPLRWNFTGNTGTGKSTVAGIMAELLKAIHLLEKGHLVQLKVEEMFNLSEYKADEALQKAMKRSTQGLLFIDGDSPLFKSPDSHFNSESLRFKLSSMTMELPGQYALIIAENESSGHTLSRNLREGGITAFDHTLHFADYNEDELLAILKSCLKRKRLQLTEEAACHMAQYIHSLCCHRKLGYANARTMSKLAHSIVETYIVRVRTNGSTDNKKVILDDVKHFVWTECGNKGIGFV